MNDRLLEELKREVVAQCEEPGCGQTGWIVTRGWDEEADLPADTMTRCPCSKHLKLSLGMHDAGLPREFWSVETLIPSFNVHAFDQLSRYANKLDAAMKHGLGFILTGRNGTGKTSSACVPLIRALREGRSAALISWPDFVDGMRRSWKDPQLTRHLDERVMRDLVVFDELGKEHVTNDETFVSGKLDSILRLRRGALLPTIITTNLSPGQLVERYGRSIESLLADRFKTLNYRPGDFRIKVERNWDEMLGDEKGAGDE